MFFDGNAARSLVEQSGETSHPRSNDRSAIGKRKSRHTAFGCEALIGQQHGVMLADQSAHLAVFDISINHSNACWLFVYQLQAMLPVTLFACVCNDAGNGQLDRLRAFGIESLHRPYRKMQTLVLPDAAKQQDAECTGRKGFDRL